MKLEDGEPGQRVRYTPAHARGDDGTIDHKLSEHGIASSRNEHVIFVRYYRQGVLQHTAQATLPDDLERFP